MLFIVSSEPNSRPLPQLPINVDQSTGELHTPSLARTSLHPSCTHAVRSHRVTNDNWIYSRSLQRMLSNSPRVNTHVFLSPETVGANTLMRMICLFAIHWSSGCSYISQSTGQRRAIYFKVCRVGFTITNMYIYFGVDTGAPSINADKLY